MVVFIKKFPDNVHQALKVRAAQEKKTMTAIIIEAVKNYLENTKGYDK